MSARSMWQANVGDPRLRQFVDAMDVQRERLDLNTGDQFLVLTALMTQLIREAPKAFRAELIAVVSAAVQAQNAKIMADWLRALTKEDERYPKEGASKGEQ